jgi:hypothetical protein
MNRHLESGQGHKVTLDPIDPLSEALERAREGWQTTRDRRALGRALLDLLLRLEEQEA